MKLPKVVAVQYDDCTIIDSIGNWRVSLRNREDRKVKTDSPMDAQDIKNCYNRIQFEIE